MKPTTALVMIVLILVSAFMIVYWDEYVTDGNLDYMELKSIDGYDSLESVGVRAYVVDGIWTHTILIEGTYNVEIYHGSDTTTAIVINTDSEYIAQVPRTASTDYNLVGGGDFAPGNGAFGMKITNVELNKTAFIWLWRA